MLKENSRKIYDYIVEHKGEDFTAQDIADATGLGIKQVNGSLTRAFHDENNANLIVREPAGTNAEGKVIKYIRTTPEFDDFDPDYTAPKGE